MSWIIPKTATFQYSAVASVMCYYEQLSSWHSEIAEVQHQSLRLQCHTSRRLSVWWWAVVGDRCWVNACALSGDDDSAATSWHWFIAFHATSINTSAKTQKFKFILLKSAMPILSTVLAQDHFYSILFPSAMYMCHTRHTWGCWLCCKHGCGLLLCRSQT